jgi:hypothetical protein
MSYYADQLREFFTHDVTDCAADEIEKLESQVAELESQLAAMTELAQLKDRAIDINLAELAEAKRIEELQDVIEHLGKVSDICTKLYTKKVCANCRCKESQKGTE